MSDLKNYVELFFEELEVFEDIEHGHCYKIFIKQAIYEFLDCETKETAFAVYRTFLTATALYLREIQIHLSICSMF